MTIGKVNANIGIHKPASRTDAVMDSKSKNIQNELNVEERRLKQLESDSGMSQQEKAKARQEIQQKIAELNRQLKLERMEKEKEAEEAKREQETKAQLQEETVRDKESARNTSTESAGQRGAEKVGAEASGPNDIKGTRTTEETRSTEPVEEPEQKQENPLTAQDIQQMLSVGVSLQQERVLNNVARQQEGRQSVLQAEIKSDRLYGTNTEAKEEQLAEMREKERLFIEPWNQDSDQQNNGKMINGKIVISDTSIV